MKLIIGLGNPGTEYENTRHNVGFLCVDFLARAWEAAPFSCKKKFEADITDVTLNTQKGLLVKPQTYMNHSGRAVCELANFYNISPADLIIIHDDLDITLGDFKIQTGKGPKIHNGLISIEESLGYADFTRVRIGVDSREGARQESGQAYVLQRFSDDQLATLNSSFQAIETQLSGLFKGLK